MKIAADFTEIEKRTGVAYPCSFYEFLEQFLELTRTLNFNSLFRHWHFCSASEVLHATKDFVGDDFIPFLVDINHEFEDYYCYEAKNLENTARIIVYSRDCIVQEWKSSYDFLRWIDSEVSNQR